MGTEGGKLDALCINTIRTLAMDAVEAANSGHPGTPMALAPVAYCLWQRFLRFDPDDPIWPDRDRFVLSCGHASMLLYSMLHLAGVKAVNPKYETLGRPTVSLEDIKRFRQLGSRCAGHPEYRWTSGVETTTGPLGQGVATSVGMAIASKWMGAHFNRPGFEMFSFDTYALAGDGCMMEGIASEAASLAGHLKLDNLCWIYDNNRITIEGHTDWAFSEDVATRFIGYGWNVTRVGDANDLEMLERAFRTFKNEAHRPTLVIVDSHIAWGAPTKQGTHEAHGAPLGAAEVRATKKNYGWPEDAQFLVPDGVREHFAAGMGKRGAEARAAWMKLFESYRQQHPDLADQLFRMQHRQLPEGWDRDLPVFPADKKGVAGRDASAKVLNRLAQNVPWLLGGSADLAPSTKTRLTFEGAGDFDETDRHGRNFHFGIREHAMAAALNGMSLSKLRPFGSGFFIFSDYARPSIRLGALMEIPVVHVFTHDSIGVGEDGPTHQPIEQLASLRAIPGLAVIRPADANEVVDAWRTIMQLRHEPAALVLSRQNLPTLDRTKYRRSDVARGAYIVADAPDGKPQVLLMATGSELALCVEAYEKLAAEGVHARVVSMPCWEFFEAQDPAYKHSVLPPGIAARVCVEQASSFGWHRYAGRNGRILAIDTFGASAPLAELQKKFGFTVDNVVAAAMQQIDRAVSRPVQAAAAAAAPGGHSLRDQLATMTVVVADTGDLASIERFRPRDATTNPSLITAAAQMPEYQEVVDDALRWARKAAGDGAGGDKVVAAAIDRLSVEFGLRILSIVPGRVSTEVDARLSFDEQATVDKAHQLIKQYEAAGASRERVLIKVASTWEGIRAAERLEKEGIHCNLTLLFGMHQAVACAEAGVTLISPFVGRILDWYKKSTGKDYAPDEDPGVVSVTRIYNYYKRHGHRTEVMGASFRNAGEIVELAGCDLLTIAPKLLDELESSEGRLVRKLDPATAARLPIDRIAMDKASFDRMHAADAMAKEKLSEGISGFSKAIVALEDLLSSRLAMLERRQRVGKSASEVFGVWDLDGDGAITREEWGGSAAVFDALDKNGDGRLTPDELSAGLGAAYRLGR